MNRKPHFTENKKKQVLFDTLWQAKHIRGIDKELTFVNDILSKMFEKSKFFIRSVSGIYVTAYKVYDLIYFCQKE